MADANTFDSSSFIAMNELARRQNREWEEQQRKSQTIFRRSISESVSGLKLLSGSTQQTAASLDRFVKFANLGAFSGAITAAISSLSDMSRTYTKMSDVGQMFGGSMFEMQKQAGESGLTLEDFAASVSKGSLVIARMNADQLKGVRGFTDYQKGVRENLKGFGYFGMTLSEVTDVTSSYAETLRMTGQWEKMTNEQRKGATVGFIKDMQGLAEVTGKSRDALMKQTAQVVSAPDISSAMANMTADQSRAITGTIGTLVATMGETTGKLFSELVVQKGATWAAPSAMEMIKAGKGNLVDQFEQLRQDTMSGKIKEGSIELFTALDNIKKSIASDESIHAGGWMQLSDRTKGVADKLLAVEQSMGGLKDPATEAAKYLKAQNDALDPVTVAILNFKTNIDALSGAFRQGFYNGIVKSMMGGAKATDHFEDSLKQMNQMFEEFGKVAGVLVSGAVDVIPTLIEAFKLLTGTMQFFEKIIENILSLFGLGNHAKTIASTAVMIGAVVAAFKLKRFASMILNAGVVKINTGRLDRGLDELDGSGGSRRRGRGGAGDQLDLDFGEEKSKSVAKSRIGRMFGNGSRGQMMAGRLGGFITGMVASTMANSIIDKISPEDSDTKEIIKDGVDVSLTTALTVFGPMLAKGIVQAVTMAVTAAGGAAVAAGGLAAGGLLAAGAEAGRQQAPMVDDQGNVIGNWGGRDESSNPAYKNPLGPISGAAATARPVTAPPDDTLAIEMFKAQMLTASPGLAPLAGDPLQAANSDDIYKALTVMTPAVMADAMKFVSDVSNRGFLTEPIKETDSFEVLKNRLVDVEALAALDKGKIAAGDTSKQEELNASINESLQIMKALLNRGVQQREDQASRDKTQLLWNALQ